MTQRQQLSAETRFAVLHKCGFKCHYCGTAAADATLVVDHVLPVAGGGTNHDGNLVAACVPCNGGKLAAVVPDVPPVPDRKLEVRARPHKPRAPSPDPLPPIARALKTWRKREGLSQRAAAESFGVPLTGWTDMEQRGTAPTTHVANVAGAIIASLLDEVSARS